jgi:glycogen synthase
MAAPPRVLIIAEAANPEFVSVPLVGWSHSRALAAIVSAHVVTQQRNREAFLRAGLELGRDFTILDSEPVAAPMWKLSERLRKLTGLGWTLTTAMQEDRAYKLLVSPRHCPR